mgnify:CR=1 FL=1
MTEYYIDIDDDVAKKLQRLEDGRIRETLIELSEEAVPEDELIHSNLSEAEKKRRQIKRIRRRGTSLGTRPDYE